MGLRVGGCLFFVLIGGGPSLTVNGRSKDLPKSDAGPEFAGPAFSGSGSDSAQLNNSLEWRGF